MFGASRRAWSGAQLVFGQTTRFSRKRDEGRCRERRTEVEAAETTGGSDALARLEVLIEKNLVQSQDGRFFMFETIRESALEHLQREARIDRAREAHARYFLTLCERAEQDIYGPNQTAWIDRLETEIDNLRAAIQWGLKNDASLTLFIARTPYPMWNFRGYSFEALGWIEQVIEREAVPDEARAAALEKLGEYLYCVSRFEDATARFQEVLVLYRALKLPKRVVFVLSQLGKCESTLGRHDQASAHLEEALEVARMDGQADTIAQRSFALGLNRFGRLDFAATRTNMAESLAHALPSGSPNTLSGRYMALDMID